MTPSVYVAAAIAKALGTTVDNLLAEADGSRNAPGMPSASRLMIPVLKWEDALKFYQERDYTELPTPVNWIVPPMEAHLGMFGLLLSDDSMQALDGLSWSRGATIIVDITSEPGRDDYALVADKNGAGLPIFRQLVSDGLELYLRPRNPQYPMRPAPKDTIFVGTVIGQVMDLTEDNSDK